MTLLLLLTPHPVGVPDEDAEAPTTAVTLTTVRSSGRTLVTTGKGATDSR